MKYEFKKNEVDENISINSVILFESEDTNCDGTCEVHNTCPIVNNKCKKK